MFHLMSLLKSVGLIVSNVCYHADVKTFLACGTLQKSKCLAYVYCYKGLCQNIVWGQELRRVQTTVSSSLKIFIKCSGILCCVCFWICNGVLRLMTQTGTYQYTEESFRNLYKYKSPEQGGDELFFPSPHRLISDPDVCQSPPSSAIQLCTAKTVSDYRCTMGCFMHRDLGTLGVALQGEECAQQIRYNNSGYKEI